MIKSVFQWIPLLFGIVALSQTSCKKDPIRLPEIEILSPSTRIFLTVPDTVIVRARISDPELRSISVALVDENFISAGVSAIIPVTGTTVQFDAELIITNPALPPGKYYLRVRAANNDEQTSAWREVTLQQRPLAKLGYTVAIGQAFDTRLLLLDTAPDPRMLYQGNLDLRRVLFNGLTQQVALIPAQAGNVLGFQLPLGNPSWQVDALTSGGVATFLAGSAFQNEFWVGLYDGRLIRLSENGTSVFSIQLPYNLLAQQITGSAHFVVVAGREQSGSSGRIVTLDKTAGGIIGEANYSGTITALLQQNATTSIAAIRNTQGNTQLVQYHFTTGALSPITFQNTTATATVVRQLAADPSGSQIFALTDQGVFKWTTQTQNFTLLVNDNFNGTTLFWDRVEEVLVAAIGSSLVSIHPNTGNITILQQLSAPILDAAIWYNR